MREREKTKRYAFLIFDADHTLLDYLADERAAFCDLYEALGMPCSEALLRVSRKHSEETWTEAGMYDVQNERIQREYHRIYRTHAEEIFQRIFAEFPCPNPSVSAKRAGELFLQKLERDGTTLGEAEKVLCALSRRTGGKYGVCIATNGITPIQTKRLARFEKYADKIYISEQTGAIKPLPAFFERILRDLHTDPSACLVVGDSLVSDVAGAKAMGMDACWFNPRRAENQTPVAPDYEISDLQQLLSFL